MQREQLDILIRPDLRLLVYPHSKDAKCFEEKDAADYGESRWQLQEGREYEYEFIDANGDPAKTTETITVRCSRILLSIIPTLSCNKGLP